MAEYDGKVVIAIDADGKKFDEKIKDIDTQLNVFGKQAVEVNKAIQTAQASGADTADLQAAKYEILKNVIQETGVKLNLLNEIQNAGEEIAGSRGSEVWINRQLEIAKTEDALRRYTAEMNSNTDMVQRQIEENGKLSVILTEAYRQGTISAEKYVDRIKAINEDTEKLKSTLNNLGGQTLLRDISDQTNKLSDNTKEAGSEVSTFGEILKANLASEAIIKGAEKLIDVIKDIVTHMKELVNETMELGDKIDKQSQIFGLSREAYQEWDYVLSLNGANISALTMGTRTLTNAIEKANSGTKSAVSAFKALGLSLEQVNKMSREELFSSVIAGLQGMTDEQKRNEIANDLLGRSYQQLIPLLNQTAEDTDKLKKAAHDNGMIMSDEAINAAVAYKDALTTLDYSLQGIKANLLTEIMPTLTDELIPIVQEFLGTLNDNLPAVKAAVQEFADSSAPKLRELAERFAEFAVNDGLPAILNALEWIADNGDEIVKIVKLLAEAWAAGKLIEFGTNLSKIPQLATNAANALNNLTTGISAVTGVSAAAVAGIGAVAAELIIFTGIIADGLDKISDGMSKITRENRISTGNIVSLGDRWKDITDMSGYEKYSQASAFLDDVLKKEEDWNARYKKNADELNALQEKKIKTFAETSRMKELQSEQASMDAEWAALEAYRVQVGNYLDKFDEDTVRRMEEHNYNTESIIRDGGKTNAEAVAEAWEKIRAVSKDKMDELDKQLATHKIDDTEYWAQRKAYLEAHRDEESEQWWKWYDEVSKHYEKLSDEERKAAEKAAADIAKAQREAETAYKKEISGKWSAAEREQAEVFAKQLNRMSDKDFKKINDDYRELDEMTSKAAADYYQNELDALQTEFIDKASALFDGISPDLEAAGINSLKSYIKGFTLGTDSAFDDLSDISKSITDKIGEGITDGSIDISDRLGDIMADENLGNTLTQNIITALENGGSDIAAAIQDIISRTGIDMQIKTSMENSAANMSAVGREMAERAVYIGTPTTGTSDRNTTSSQPQDLMIHIKGEITADGRRNIARIVEEEFHYKQTRTGT